MKQKPVAWMMVHCENGSAYLTFEKPTREQKITHTPHELYTSPQYRELSDDEITDLASKYIERATSTLRDECVDFARAILRKAQE